MSLAIQEMTEYCTDSVEGIACVRLAFFLPISDSTRHKYCEIWDANKNSSCYYTVLVCGGHGDVTDGQWID